MTTKSLLLIGGRELNGTGFAEVRDPGRFDDVVGLTAQADVHLVGTAVEAAHRAFRPWANTPVAERIALLGRLADILETERESLVTTVVAETGLLPVEIRLEIAGSIAILRDTMAAAESFLNPRTEQDETSWVRVHRKPAGVVAGFAPWNAPIALMVRKLAPALACGNTIVFKSPPTAPLGMGMVLRYAAELLPDGVVNLVHGGEDVGRALVAHPLVRRVSFTGGHNAASAIMKSAADTMKNVQFELGGNDPAIILDDMDLETQMSNLASGIFHRSGQFCFAVKRVYVPESIYEDFFARLTAEVSVARVGHPTDARTTFGPVNNRPQFEYVRRLVGDARDSGADVRELGEAVDPDAWRRGYYLKPVLVGRPSPEIDLVRCEQFGPAVPVLPYRNEDEVVAMANDTEFGLGSSIWTTEPDRATALARKLDVGMTFVNKNAQSRLGRRHSPFGGTKRSGIGRENSTEGLADYVEYHAINAHL